MENDESIISFETKPYLFSFSDHFGTLLFGLFALGNAIYSYFNHDRHSTFVMLLATVVSVITSIVLFKKMPKNVTLSSNGITLDNNYFAWSNIERIAFTLTWGKNTHRVVYINLKEKRKVEIRLIWFKEALKFREIIEVLAKSNGVKTCVEDRGM